MHTHASRLDKCTGGEGWGEMDIQHRRSSKREREMLHDIAIKKVKLQSLYFTFSSNGKIKGWAWEVRKKQLCRESIQIEKGKWKIYGSHEEKSIKAIDFQF